MNNRVNSIVIVGGGTAGWLTAGIVAALHRAKIQSGHLTITVCESPNVPAIGVGEGTWPTMPQTLRLLGISETEFIRQCDASFKQGSKFIGWRNETIDEAYYHPFEVPNASLDGLLAEYWLSSPLCKESFAASVSVEYQLAKMHLAPKNITDSEYASPFKYGYHLNAGNFSKMLQQHCVEKLGVQQILANVVDVKRESGGNIASLEIDGGRSLKASLYIDCSGFKSILLGQAMGVGFNSVADTMFADTALVAQADYASENTPIRSCTHSTATDAGWIWDISLPSRRGFGHVYSSSHMSDTAAEQQLTQYYKTTEKQLSGRIIESNAPLSLRRIQFSPGYRKQFWSKNCVAVGLSAGFLEPLEASALVLVELSARMIAEQLPATSETMYFAERKFNKKFAYHWARAIDFLKLHYVLSQRKSHFWQDNRASKSVPDSLQDLLLMWRHTVPSITHFEPVDELFQSINYQFVLYGSGHKSELLYPMAKHEQDFAAKQLERISQQKQHFSKGLPTNRELINKIRQYGLSRS